MAIAETWKFNENVGKVWNLEGFYAGYKESEVKTKGVEDILIVNIVESETGDEFRDHTYIRVSKSVFNRYFTTIKENTPITFKARTYYYSKKARVGITYVPVAIGLTDIMDIRIKRKPKPEDEGKDKNPENKTLGWLLHTIKDKEYKIVEYRYPKMDTQEVTQQMVVDVVNTLIRNRGSQKEYNLFVFRAEGSIYRATLSLLYTDYSILKGKDIKRPYYRNKRFKNTTQAYLSDIPLEKGKMVLTIVHEATGEIRDTYGMTVNNNKQYVDVLKMMIKYLNAHLPEEYLKDNFTNKAVQETGNEHIREVSIIEPE